jgi:hypothetical protein
MLDIVFLFLTLILGMACLMFFMAGSIVFSLMLGLLGIASFVMMFNTHLLVKPKITRSTIVTNKVRNFQFSRGLVIQVTKTEYPWRLQDSKTQYYVDLDKQDGTDLTPPQEP